MNYRNSGMINLVADIGGTNIRLATASAENDIEKIKTYQCAQFDSLLSVIYQNISEQGLLSYRINACLAIACPVY